MQPEYAQHISDAYIFIMVDDLGLREIYKADNAIYHDAMSVTHNVRYSRTNGIMERLNILVYRHPVKSADYLWILIFALHSRSGTLNCQVVRHGLHFMLLSKFLK